MRNMQFYLIFSLALPIGCRDKSKDPARHPDEGAPNLEISPYSVDFGEVALGVSSSTSLTLQNTGTADLLIDTVELKASGSWLSRAALTLPMKILPEQSATINIQCAPDASRLADSNTLLITSNDPAVPTEAVLLSCGLLTDADGDGHDDAALGGDDCDDSDPDIYSGAPDAWYDGIDSNCDGANDCDQDGDGFESIVCNPDPHIYVAGMAPGGDCQDTNPETWPDYFDYTRIDPVTGEPLWVVNPNEVWYDGIDSNCDGADDYDADADGYRSLAEGRGSDCDDMDETVHIDALEKLNALDDDCDGRVDFDVPGFNADHSDAGPEANDQAGYSVLLADLDRDGYAEVISGSPRAGKDDHGEVVLFSGALIATATTEGLDFSHIANAIEGDEGDQLGATVAFLGDTLRSSTGSPDIALGAPGADGGRGAVYILDAGDAFYGGGLSSDFLTVRGEEEGQQVGAGIASLIDLNGDAASDILGVYSDEGEHSLWLAYGGARSERELTLSDVDARLSAEGDRAFIRRSVSPGGDLDGDGYDDFVFCDASAGLGGRVWILWGDDTKLDGALALGEVGSTPFSGASHEQLGKMCGIGEDTDGDEDRELWIQVVDASGNRSGIYMVGGSTDLREDGLDISESYSRYYEMSGRDPGTYAFGRAGDWDNDGIGDVAFGLEPSSILEGRLWIFSSADEDGDYTDADAIASAYGDGGADQEAYGSAISPLPGDVNADGLHDFVVGDAGFDRDFGLIPDAGGLWISFQAR